MGCTQSKAREPERVDAPETSQDGANEVPKDGNAIDSSNQAGEANENQETHAPVVRKELDIKPPPVKAIPKITPKSIPKKGA